jgi:hypothetical protein
MGIGLYDSEQVQLSMNGSGQVIDPLRTVHDGKKGGAHDTLLHVRNDNAGLWYHDIVVEYEADVGIDAGPLGNTGWAIKFIAGTRQPTEREWEQAVPGGQISLANLGAAGDPDTTTYLPFWARVYCPGGTPAQLRVGQLVRVSYIEEPV